MYVTMLKIPVKKLVLYMCCSRFSQFYSFLITQGILITELQSNLFKTGV